jgi:hypothetical protein
MQYRQYNIIIILHTFKYKSEFVSTYLLCIFLGRLLEILLDAINTNAHAGI